MSKIKLLKILLIMLIATFSLSSYCFAKDFTDIDSSHWAFQYVDELSNSGIINGYDDGTFKPSGTITRAEFIKLLVASDEDLVKVVDYMKSKSTSNKWYKPYVDLAQLFINMPTYSDDLLTLPINRFEVAYITASFLVYNERKVENQKEEEGRAEKNDAYIKALRSANEKLKYIKDKNLSDVEFTTALFSLSEDKRLELSTEADKIVNPAKAEIKYSEPTSKQMEEMVVAWNKVLKELNYTDKDEDADGIKKICDSMSEDEYREAHLKAIEEYYRLTNQVFSDIADLSSMELAGLVKVKDANIINGYEDGTFKPYNTITRAESAKVIHEYIRNYKMIKGGV